jgi:Zn finger protein HypA/HybF involved in hydrogenase expression
VSGLTPLHRTLEQELLAVLRGASLECPVCGEFVLHEDSVVRCPECSMRLHGRIEKAAGAGVQSGSQAG